MFGGGKKVPVRSGSGSQAAGAPAANSAATTSTSTATTVAAAASLTSKKSPSPLPGGSSSSSSSSSSLTRPLNLSRSTSSSSSSSSSSKSSASDFAAFEKLLSDFENALHTLRPDDDSTARRALLDLQSHILRFGIPSSSPPSTTGIVENASLRGRVWKWFLHFPSAYSVDDYLALVAACKEEQILQNVYEKIRGDAFRTFTNEDFFKSEAVQKSFIRLSCTFVKKYGQKPKEEATNRKTSQNNTNNSQNQLQVGQGPLSARRNGIPENESKYQFSYCQGMNAIAMCMLYNMPEPEAFLCFCSLITTHIPLYYLSSHIGAEAGSQLVHEILKEVDNELFKVIEPSPQRRMDPYVYAFHAVSSLMGSIPPFSELMKLWDFLFIFGPHLAPVLVAAQIISFRDQLFAKRENPNAVLHYLKWPPLNAKMILLISVDILKLLPRNLMTQIEKHGNDMKVAQQITGRKFDIAEEEKK